MDVLSVNFGEVRENLAGFVIKTTKESFKGISLHTDVTTGSALSSGKVCSF